MLENVQLSRKQAKFLQELLLGQTIRDAAKQAGITEQTGHRWLKLPHIQAERTRLETELREAEEREITRIMTTGYAAVHERVKALDALAREMEQPYKGVKGQEYGLRNSPDHVREWRGILDDIAKETGGRVKKQEIEHSGLIDLLNSEHAALLAELAALPDGATQNEKQDSAAGADTDITGS